MADQPEELQPDDQEEEGGGPVKSFLEHLEDLRWVLINSLVAVGIAMLICLIAGNSIMVILKRPLERSSRISPGTNQVLALHWGTNWWTFTAGTNEAGKFPLGTNRVTAFAVAPVRSGTNILLGLEPFAGEVPENLAVRRVDLLNLGPAGGFIVAFKLAIYAGILIASPFVVFFLARFIVPALRMNEKRYIFRGFGIGTFLFLIGVSFCYFVLLPFALRASVQYSNWLGLEANQWNAEEYLSFVCKFMLGMGLGFEMPVFILILVKLGIVNYRQLAGFRRYMIVINLILGAVLTTPEVLTQVLMALPLQVLYEISVWIAWYWERKERKREAALSATS